MPRPAMPARSSGCSRSARPTRDAMPIGTAMRATSATRCRRRSCQRAQISGCLLLVVLRGNQARVPATRATDVRHEPLPEELAEERMFGRPDVSLRIACAAAASGRRLLRLLQLRFRPVPAQAIGRRHVLRRPLWLIRATCAMRRVANYASQLRTVSRDRSRTRRGRSACKAMNRELSEVIRD